MARKMKRALWRIADIKPYPRNPRTHPPAQVKMLGGLLKKYGPDQDIVVDEKGVIIKGHGRRLGAIEAGLKTFPVTQRFDLSDVEKTSMRIEDNQVTLLGGWDTDLIRGELKSLSAEGFDLGLLGFGEAQLVSFQTTPQPPNEFAQFGEDIPTEHQCPKCGYRWSGKPTPESDGDARATNRRSSSNGKNGATVQRRRADMRDRVRQGKDKGGGASKGARA